MSSVIEHTTLNYLDLLMRQQKMTTDRQVGQLLGWDQPKVSHYRTSLRIMANEECVRLAHALGLPPCTVIKAADLERASKAGVKSNWDLFGY